MKVVLEKTIYSRAAGLFDVAAQKHGLEWCFVQPLEEDKALAFHEEGAGTFVIGTKKYSAEFYNSLRPGSLVQRFGVGYSSVPVDLCKDRGIRVGYTPGVLDAAVAEHTMALLLALSRTIPTFDRDMKAGIWNKIAGSELRGKTLALIGFGRIAREVAKIAENGFGMKIVYFDIDSECTLEECLQTGDYVSLHLPETPDTAGRVNAEFLSKMKPSAFLINTARGGLVDEPALFQWLEKKQIAGAALDVFVKEPYEPRGGNFQTLENVILTPHCASNTAEANARMAEICIANCVAMAQQKFDDLTLIPE